jgi:hypothetical protein
MVHEATRFIVDMYDIETSHADFSVSDDYKVTAGGPIL